MKIQIDEANTRLKEDEIISLAKKDASEFRPLYIAYFKPIFLFILHRCGDKTVAADLCSQVFLKALINLHQYTPRGLPFSSWLYRIATNECNDFFRRTNRARLVVLEDHIAEHIYDELFDQDPMNDLKQALPTIISRLSLDEIQLIELRFMENMPFKEVAEILGITENNAKVKTYRVLDKMKTMFLNQHA